MDPDTVGILRADGHRRVVPAEMGINSTLDGLLPRNSSVADWHYSAASGVNSLCPPPDLRVHCSGGSDTANYTETEPVGVLVHEMRVATRLANR